jgi:hypothetical protein
MPYLTNSVFSIVSVLGVLYGKCLYKYPIQGGYMEVFRVMSVLGVLYGKCLYKYPIQGGYMESFSIINSCAAKNSVEAVV